MYVVGRPDSEEKHVFVQFKEDYRLIFWHYIEIFDMRLLGLLSNYFSTQKRQIRKIDGW